MVDNKRKLIKMIEIRKTKSFGHVIRHNFIIIVMERKINVKRTVNQS